MRIIRDMTRHDLEGRALDAIERLTAEERRKLANVLRLLGFANNDRDMIGLAKEVGRG